MKESPLFWPVRLKLKLKEMHVLDETLIPKRMQYIKVKNTKEAVCVIKNMKTRAFGQFLVVLNIFLLEMANYRNLKDSDMLAKIKATAQALNNSRPTFPFAEVTTIIVGWAQWAVNNKADLRSVVSKNIDGYLKGVRFQRLDRVERIAKLIKNGDCVLTHCNVSGELAMAAAICKEQGKDVHFFATETRPYFQGAKLTAWELKRMGAKVTVIADNAAGTVMADGIVNKVIVGSDRSCANGDFANKIGTYQLAVLADVFKIPFYVLTQPSNKVKKGDDMPIELRDAKELLFFDGKKTYEGKVDGFYPGFDIIPHKYVTRSIAIKAT